MELRTSLIQNLLKNFLNDLAASVKPLSSEESIQFISVLIDFLRGIYNQEEPNPEFEYEGYLFDEDEFIDKKLLDPYREKMVPFIKTRLRLYFSKDDYNKSLLFQKLGISELSLSEEEYNDYILRLFFILRKIKENLYLKPSDKVNLTSGIETQQVVKEQEEFAIHGLKTSKGYTRSRQVLMYYFVLRLMGISKMETKSIQLAEFGHALMYWPVPNVYNGDLYKLLCEAPYLKDKSRQALIKDLEYVKRQFSEIEHEQGIIMVQKEIDALKGK